jgi:hypothetical protein
MVSVRMVRLAVLTAIFSGVAGLALGQEPAPPGSVGDCVADAHTLCLNNGRFAVTARFRTASSGETDATAVGLTADSGYFWFFNPANIEVVVKVLRACSLTNHYWVFATGLTDVQVTLFVTDTEHDSLKTYTNQLGVPFAPIQDTRAFATCP